MFWRIDSLGKPFPQLSSDTIVFRSTLYIPTTVATSSQKGMGGSFKCMQCLKKHVIVTIAVRDHFHLVACTQHLHILHIQSTFHNSFAAAHSVTAFHKSEVLEASQHPKAVDPRATLQFSA